MEVVVAYKCCPKRNTMFIDEIERGYMPWLPRQDGSKHGAGKLGYRSGKNSMWHKWRCILWHP
jgi:hypothetical protein